jgi:hypothetical protein
MYWIALAAVLATASWKDKVKHLTDTEFDHYYALRVYMDDEQMKKFLKMKTVDERDAYLKELGLWERFYKYDEHIRQKIIDGEVQTGWTIDMLYMSWGAPYDRRKLAGRKAMRSELLVYRFEEQPDGRVLVWTEDSKTEYKAARLFEREVVVDDDVVTSIEQKEAHW